MYAWVVPSCRLNSPSPDFLLDCKCTILHVTNGRIGALSLSEDDPLVPICNKVVNFLPFLHLQDSVKYENPALYSHEHAMAKLVAYKHLPPSLELSDYTPPSTPSTPRTPATPTLEQRQTPV